MAARKRGKGGKFVKGGAKKKRRKKTAAKHHVAAPAHSGGGGGMPISALHKLDNINKAVHRIENRLVPKRVKERLARLRGSKEARARAHAAERESEHSLFSKYG
ncbi:MAG TPA: hypothetical protein VF077_09675 [Nitrospiraceae bacterium]